MTNLRARIRRTRSSPRYRTASLVSAVCVALLVVVCLVIVLVQKPASVAAPPAAPAPAAPPQGALPDQTVPQSAPTGVAWTVFASMALPSSSAGPHQIHGAQASGYAHSPVGALLAAVQINARAFLAPGQQWRPVATRQLVAGPGRDAYIKLRSGLSTDGMAPGSTTQIAAFQFVTYRPQLAVIELAAQDSKGRYSLSTVTMQWSGDDWQLAPTSSGLLSTNPRPIDDLSGLVPWAGV